MHASTLVRFPDRRSAYQFVSEIRRRYDLNGLASLRVQPAGNDVVVEMPNDRWSNEVADVAARHGGREPASNFEFEKLRAAMAAARQTERETRPRPAPTYDTVQEAHDAVHRAKEGPDEGLHR